MPELGSPQLTSKELSMIEDQLAHEQLAIAKLQAYSEQATDAEVQRLCEAGARKHQSHYDTLLKHLKAKEIGREGV
ncbi:MAG TPA: spore coat protein [Firmicutes bacterium]|nr:spore coat protein [Bacillota bacterium]